MKDFGESQSPKQEKCAKKKTNVNQEQFISEFKCHSQGNISKAAKYYQLFLDKGFISSIILINYGALCKQIGETEKSIKLFKKAVEVDPNHASANEI